MGRCLELLPIGYPTCHDGARMRPRFQRRIRVLPGVHLNLSAHGAGLSIGGRGAHVGITARGQRYTRVGLPGTGISWREYKRKPAAHQCNLCAPGHRHVPAALVVALLVLAALVVLAVVGRNFAH
jgi:hypothetical protein